MAKKPDKLDRKFTEFSRVTFLDENGRPKSAAWLYSFMLGLLYAILYAAVFIGTGLLLGRLETPSGFVIVLQYLITAVIGSVPCVALFFAFREHKGYVVGAYIWLAVLVLLMVPTTLLMSGGSEDFGWSMWMFCIYIFFPAILCIGVGGSASYLLYQRSVRAEQDEIKSKNRPSYYNT